MFRQTKENGLLYIGAGVFICTSILYSVVVSIDSKLINFTNKFGDFDNIILILFSTLLIAPITEELVFRGFFIKKKVFSYLFYCGTIIFCIISNNYYLILLLIVLLFLQIIKSQQKYLYYFFNSLIFALIHYKVHDFNNIFSIIPVFFQLSLGMFLIWITLNYGLIKSIFTHFIINLILLTPMIVVLQFPIKKTHLITFENGSFECQKTSIIGNTKIHVTPNYVKAERVTLNQFIKLFQDENLKLTVNDSIRFYRYNITIKTKDKKITSDMLKKSLLSSKLVEVKNEK